MINDQVPTIFHVKFAQSIVLGFIQMFLTFFVNAISSRWALFW